MTLSDQLEDSLLPPCQGDQWSLVGFLQPLKPDLNLGPLEELVAARPKSAPKATSLAIGVAGPHPRLSPTWLGVSLFRCALFGRRSEVPVARCMGSVG